MKVFRDTNGNAVVATDDERVTEVSYVDENGNENKARRDELPDKSMANIDLTRRRNK